MRLNQYFRSEEFECPCCGLFIENEKLLEILTAVREHFGVPVMINSGTRCLHHNTAVGGAQTSQHLYGSAADIVVAMVDSHEVYEWIENKFFPGGLGKYDTFTHVDTREHQTARWEG